MLVRMRIYGLGLNKKGVLPDCAIRPHGISELRGWSSRVISCPGVDIVSRDWSLLRIAAPNMTQTRDGGTERKPSSLSTLIAHEPLLQEQETAEKALEHQAEAEAEIHHEKMKWSSCSAFEEVGRWSSVLQKHSPEETRSTGQG